MKNLSSKIFYDDAACSFQVKCLKLCHQILKNETTIVIKQSRIHHQSISYPLQVVVFEGQGRLGYFDSFFMEIGISKSLMFADDHLLKNIIRHELAHLITYLEWGTEIQDHGKEFHQVCNRHGWQVAKPATLPETCLAKSSEKLQQRIRKLLDLGSSSNIHEAESALTKARHLMSEHGIDMISGEEKWVVARPLQQKRIDEKLRVITTILRAFCVYPVLNQGKGLVYLEIFGEPSAVEVAEYIAHSLYHTLDQLWENQYQFCGLRAKNSFFRGIATGFLQRIHRETKQKSALIKLEKVLQKAALRAYPHLRTTQQKRKYDKAAMQSGTKMGANLSLPKGVKGNSKSDFFLSHKD